jgi:predicted dehydrogenase
LRGGHVVEVAVVGVGNWGPNLARNVAHIDDCALGWVCDIDGDRAREVARQFGGRPTRDLAEVLNDESIDAVAIATPPATHGAISRACLATGRHVFVEKPLTTTCAEALILAELAALRGRVLMCDHTYCFSPIVQRLHALVRDGELGALQRVRSTRINHGHPRPGVDVFWDLAHHDLAILDFLLPEGYCPVAVECVGFDPTGIGCATKGDMTVHLEGDATADLHLDWLGAAKVRTMEFEGSRQTARWDDLARHRRLRLGAGHAAPIENGIEPLREALREFVAAIIDVRSPMIESAAELRVLSILEAARQSQEQRGALIPLLARAAP